MKNLMAIEKEGQRVLTTQQLAEVYDSDEKTLLRNFQRNKERYQEAKHYFSLTGQALQDFKASRQNDVTFKYVSVLYLWTERGALRHAKSLGTDKAWEVYEQLEETYFGVKGMQTPIQQLSPQLQLLINMELEQKKLKAAVQETKEEVQAIREVVEIRPSENWRNETNNLIKKICVKLSDYQRPKEELYKALQERGACDLKRRLENMRARFIINGGTKSKANQMNYLDVIAEDKKLVEIYIAIVKEMAIKNKIA